MTNMPIRNCMTRSFMSTSSLAIRRARPDGPGDRGAQALPRSRALGHLAEPLAGLAADELADARVGMRLPGPRAGRRR